MKCPNCNSENVNVQIAQSTMKTTSKGTGLLGNLNNAARGVTAVATLGASNIFWKKSKGTSKTKVGNKAFAVCQNCGHSWEVKK